MKIGERKDDKPKSFGVWSRAKAVEGQTGSACTLH